ncbi:MAG: hypothetical protein AAFX81_04845 [Pseudomonadota bacterium]
MIASACLAVLGVAMVGFGARHAGTPPEFAADRHGSLVTTSPGQPGAAHTRWGCLAGEALQAAGYVVVILALMLAI